MQLALKNKETGNTYRILKWDKEANEITLQGKHSTFTEKFDKDSLKKMGYTLVQEEAPPKDPDDED